MKQFILFAMCLIVLGWPAISSAQAAVNVIFDTDMGNDVDDALALAMLHAFQSPSRGQSAGRDRHQGQ